MADTQMRYRSERPAEAGGVIEGFAARVLDVLAGRGRRSSPSLREDLVVSLAEVMVTQDEQRIEATLADFRRSCISPDAMTDLYVPEAARYLGSRWCSDDMSFAEVTIASARLQAMVRAIGTRRGTESANPDDRAPVVSVLVVVPAAEHHTLGAIVATDQMRRAGLSVCLRLGPKPGELADLVRSHPFGAVMVSAGHGDGLDGVRKLIAELRGACPKEIPVAVGGPAVLTGKDVVRLTGADFASEDVGKAMAACGLTRKTTMAEFGLEGAAKLHA